MIIIPSAGMEFFSSASFSFLHVNFLFLSFLSYFLCYNSMQLGHQGSSFLSGLKQRLLLLPIDAARAGTHYNIPLINSLVLYVGIQVT